MPNCFSLTDKRTGELASLSGVDDRMREHFGAPPDPDKFYESWYNVIGFALACGRTLPELIERLAGKDEALHAIALWLAEHYTSDAWAERR
jgi:hypothetical protein